MSLMRVCDVCGKTMRTKDEFSLKVRSKAGHYLSVSLRVEEMNSGMGSWDICSDCVREAMKETT